MQHKESKQRGQVGSVGITTWEMQGVSGYRIFIVTGYVRSKQQLDIWDDPILKVCTCRLAILFQRTV